MHHDRRFDIRFSREMKECFCTHQELYHYPKQTAGLGAAAAEGADGTAVLATRLPIPSDFDSALDSAFGSALMSPAVSSVVREAASAGRGRGKGLADEGAETVAPNIGEG